MPIELEADREVNVTVSAMASGESRNTPAYHRIRAAGLTHETMPAEFAEALDPSRSYLPRREGPSAAAHRAIGISTDVGPKGARRGTEAEKALEERVVNAEIRILEMRHRIANSLQIVGSILQLKARSVESEEAREHLQDAHHRLVAVAAVQEQLNGSDDGETISVEPYLRRLCRSVARSIAGDELSVVVDAPDRMAHAAFVTSLGLIVTELLTNAVKHAFPEGTCDRRVEVAFQYEAGGWRLEVSDNGIGVAGGSDGRIKYGLGTRVVAALARSLGARIEVSTGHGGTRISVRRPDPRESGC